MIRIVFGNLLGVVLSVFTIISPSFTVENFDKTKDAKKGIFRKSLEKVFKGIDIVFENTSMRSLQNEIHKINFEDPEQLLKFEQRKANMKMHIAEACAQSSAAAMNLTLGFLPGAAICVSTITRALVYYQYRKRDKPIPKKWAFVFTAVAAAGIAATWTPGLSIFLLPAVLDAAVEAIHSVNAKKVVMIIQFASYARYDFTIRAYVAAIGCVCTVVVAVKSLITNIKNERVLKDKIIYTSKKELHK